MMVESLGFAVPSVVGIFIRRVIQIIASLEEASRKTVRPCEIFEESYFTFNDLG